MDLAQGVLLTSGIGLGLLHAFDADHVMAVTGLAQRRRPVEVVMLCARWALGHGLTLLLLTLGLVVFGWQLDPQASRWAERIIGLLLIGVGGLLLYGVARPRIRIETHIHGGVVHTHLVAGAGHTRNHLPVLVGVVHGVAGSAPVLAVVPALSQGQLLPALLYVLLFSLGVMTSMLVFGISLGASQRWLQRTGPVYMRWGRGLLGTLSMGFGGYWLSLSFHLFGA